MHRPLRSYNDFTKLQKALVNLSSDDVRFEPRGIIVKTLQRVCFVCGSSQDLRKGSVEFKGKKYGDKVFTTFLKLVSKLFHL